MIDSILFSGQNIMGGAVLLISFYRIPSSKLFLLQSNVAQSYVETIYLKVLANLCSRIVQAY